jgi:hypothetical protein
MYKYSPPAYLLLTPKGVFFRLRVPRQLQGEIGKRELKKAIRTIDRTLAERQVTETGEYSIYHLSFFGVVRP